MMAESESTPEGVLDFAHKDALDWQKCIITLCEMETKLCIQWPVLALRQAINFQARQALYFLGTESISDRDSPYMVCRGVGLVL